MIPRAAPSNFIFREEDLQLTGENGNAGPAPRASGHLQNAQDLPSAEIWAPSRPVCGPRPLSTLKALRRQEGAKIMAGAACQPPQACLESALVTHGTV